MRGVCFDVADVSSMIHKEVFMKTLNLITSFSIPALLIGFAYPHSVRAWGDEGHEVVALVADAFLTLTTHQRVNAILAADTDTLTAHDIASEATWADKLRDANIDGSRLRTRQWHFVDIEINNPNVDQ